jgi:UDP-N-acetylglucosamine 3-dehydrogenase
MSNLRAGVIGLGAMGRHHVRILRELDGVDLVAVADPAGDKFGVAGQLQVGDSVEHLIKSGVDIAVVAVPTAYHEQVGLALAGAGIHAMVEKPVASSYAAAQRLSDAFSQAGLIGCVGHVERFNPAISELRRRVKAGELGRVYQVATSRQSTFPARIADVGVVMDLATHDINTTQWLVGDYASVSAQVTHQAGRDHEDLVVASGRTHNGVLVNHLVNWLSPMKVRLTTVTGERGTLVADTARVSLTFWENGSAPAQWENYQQFYGVSEGDTIRYALQVVEPLKAEDEAFRDAVLGRTSEAVSMEEGARTLQVAQAILDSAHAGESIHLAD